MRINDPKSLIFIDGIKGSSGVVEDFATITYVDKSINKNYGKVIWDIKDAMEVGSGIVWKQDSGDSDHPYKVSLQLDKEDTETKRYLDFNGEYTPAALRVKNISSDINKAKNEILTGALNGYNTANAVKNKFTGIDTKLAGINSSVTGYVSDKIYTNINGAVEAGRGLIITNTNNSDFPKALSINLESGGQTDKYLTLNGESVPGTLEVQGIDEAIETAKSEILTGALKGYTASNTVSSAINGLSNRINNIVADALSISGSNTIDITQGVSGIQIISTKINSNDKVLGSDSNGLSSAIKLVKLGTPSVGYASTYKLVGKDGITALGDVINIPKDQFLTSAEFILSATQAQANEANQNVGAGDNIVNKGDSCIRFIFATKQKDPQTGEETATDQVVYVNTQSLVDTYTPGRGISISESNEISLNIGGSTLGGIKGGGDITINGGNGVVTVNAANKVKHSLKISDYTFDGSNSGEILFGDGINVEAPTNYPIISLKTAASDQIGGIKSGGDITVISDTGLVTVNQATKVKKSLKFGSKTFDGSASGEILASDLGALTGVPLANGNTVGGIKTGGDITVTNGVVTVTQANKVKHGLSVGNEFTFDGSSDGEIIFNDAFDVVVESNDPIISLKSARSNLIGGVRSGGDITVSNVGGDSEGAVTVNAAGKVKKSLKFGSKTFDGSASGEILASDLGALTSVPLANGNTVGGIKTAGDITVANGVVTVLSAGQVKHGITFNYPAGQADRITAETGIFNGSANGSITPGNGIYFTYGQGSSDLIINADVNASTVTTSKNDVITGYLGFANTTKPVASATILSQMIAIQPVQFSTNQMSTSGNVYQREIIFDGESENINFRKVYYDVSGYVFETIALDTNETFITEMQHLDNGNTRLFLDLPWDTSANKPIIRWEMQNEQRVGVTGKLSFKAVAFVNANGGKINVKSTINFDN